MTMTYNEAKKYILNWKNIENFFSQTTINKVLKDFNLRDFTSKEDVPVESYRNTAYEKNGYIKENKTPKIQTITEYCTIKGAQWERRVSKSCYTWLIPDKYQLREMELVREALLLEYPYLNKYDFLVYHFDNPADENGIKEKKENMAYPFKHNYFGMEIYIKITEGEKTGSLYVPLIALKTKDLDIIINRHKKYHEEYYKGKDREKFLKQALDILETNTAQNFMRDIKTKKKFKLPVTWEVSGVVEVEADNIEEAVEIFDSTCDEIPLPSDSDYVDASFDLSCREISYLELFQ